MHRTITLGHMMVVAVLTGTGCTALFGVQELDFEPDASSAYDASGSDGAASDSSANPPLDAEGDSSAARDATVAHDAGTAGDGAADVGEARDAGVEASGDASEEVDAATDSSGTHDANDAATSWDGATDAGYASDADGDSAVDAFQAADAATDASPLTPTSLSILPTSYAFGGVDAGATSQPVTFTLTNSGETPTAPLSVGLTYGAGTAGSEFAIIANACGGTTLASRSCDVTVQFSPSTYGNKSAAVNVNGLGLSATITGLAVDFPTLTVTKSGNGTGTVTNSDGSINCGAQCSATYTRTTANPIVTLAAVPAGGMFTGWSGGGCGGSGACTITLSQSTTVNAAFKK